MEQWNKEPRNQLTHMVNQDFPGDSVVKNPLEMQVRSPGQEDLLEKEMATNSSILAWEIPWIEEPDRLHQGTKSGTRLGNYQFHFLFTALTKYLLG